MYECACSLQPEDDDPFFSGPIENWHLTADNMSETLKKGAMLYGFNEQRFAPHSLRIADASTSQFLKYIRLSTEAFQQSITAISSCTVFNSDDIRMWNAGVDLIHAASFKLDRRHNKMISPPHMFPQHGCWGVGFRRVTSDTSCPVNY